MHFKRKYLALGEQEILSLERARDDCRIVLAGYAHQNSCTRQGSDQLLVEPMHLGVAIEMPRDAVEPVIAYNSRPERVIQIGDQTFFRWPRLDQVGEQLGQRRSMVQRVRKAGGHIRLDVVALPGRRDRIEELRIRDSNGALCGQRVRQRGAQLPQAGLKQAALVRSEEHTSELQS